MISPHAVLTAEALRAGAGFQVQQKPVPAEWRWGSPGEPLPQA